LRHGWKKFWLLASLSAILLISTGASLAALGTNDQARVNELTLAGLRPGHDKIESPKKIFRGLEQDEAAKDGLVWGDSCTHCDLRVEVDSHHVIRTVTVSSYYKPETMTKCVETVAASARLRMLKSGHGLMLGDACSHVMEIYGKPESETPSVNRADQLELFYYGFGWAGSEVPQVMEISCSQATEKVVEIMLAASSLGIHS
jgi:hypothetical protein